MRYPKPHDPYFPRARFFLRRWGLHSTKLTPIKARAPAREAVADDEPGQRPGLGTVAGMIAETWNQAAARIFPVSSRPGSNQAAAKHFCLPSKEICLLWPYLDRRGLGRHQAPVKLPHRPGAARLNLEDPGTAETENQIICIINHINLKDYED